MSFQGKVAIITGASKNLGRLTATEFAKEGCNLALHYHSDKEGANLAKLINELQSTYKIKAIAVQGDLTTEAANKVLFDTAIKTFGHVDYAINNVGMVLRKNLADISAEEFDTMFSVNTRAAFLFLRECANKVAENGAVVMLTTSLLAAYTDGYSVYQAAKSGVMMMCKTLSKEDKKKISYNCVSPGPMDTPFLYGQENEQRVEFFKTVTPAARLTETTDIVPIIKFLVKDGHWMTGQNLFASNGFTAP